VGREDCVFCRIVKGEEESYTVYDDSDIQVILDKYPVSRGHLLVITKKHYEGVQDVEPPLLAKAWLAASALASVYRKELKASGVNVVTNSGRAAGQVVFHFHIHVIPRWSAMGSEFWGERRILTDDEAKRVLSMVAPYAPDYIRRFTGSL